MGKWEGNVWLDKNRMLCKFHSNRFKRKKSEFLSVYFTVEKKLWHIRFYLNNSMVSFLFKQDREVYKKVIIIYLTSYIYFCSFFSFFCSILFCELYLFPGHQVFGVCSFSKLKNRTYD